MTDNTIYRTNYFRKSWTWIKRILVFLVLVLIVIWWESNEAQWNYWWIKYLIFSFLSLGLFLSSVDDIMIDDNYFYHIKTSLIDYFTKVDEYDLSTIKTLRCIGIHEQGFTLAEMGHTRHFSTDSNTVEITFKDGSYKSLELTIYKSELLAYVSKIRERLT